MSVLKSKIFSLEYNVDTPFTSVQHLMVIIFYMNAQKNGKKLSEILNLWARKRWGEKKELKVAIKLRPSW